jgi:hypothetical protein
MYHQEYICSNRVTKHNIPIFIVRVIGVCLEERVLVEEHRSSFSKPNAMVDCIARGLHHVPLEELA